MVLNERAHQLVSLAGCARGLKPAPYYIVANALSEIGSIIEPRSNQKDNARKNYQRIARGLGWSTFASSNCVESVAYGKSCESA